MTNARGVLLSGRPQLFDGFNALALVEDGYEIKCGLSVPELDSVSRLRAEVFCGELGWVGTPQDTHEIDGFDDAALPIAVFKDREAVACLRLHPHTSDWMACTVFKDLLHVAPDAIKAPDACEVSRLALSQEFRSQRFEDGRAPVDALYAGLFTYCTLNQIRYVYMIVSLPVLRALRHRGLPCEEIGPRKRMGDGVIALAARLDWVRFVEINRTANPQRLDRFLSTLKKAAAMEHIEKSTPHRAQL